MSDRSRTLHKLRPLDGLEKAFWLLNQNRPTHFAAVAEIEGLATETPLLAAADAVGRQIPFLAARILVDGRGEPYFALGEASSIPVTVVQSRGRPWTVELEDEMSAPFDPAAAPLARLRIVVDGARHVVILSMHHSIGDGRSAVFLMRDILRSAGGETVIPAYDPRSVEQALEDSGLPVREIPPLREGQAPPPGYRAAALTRPRIAARTVEAAELEALRLKARAEGATIHGALCAAAARAYADARPAHPVNPPRVFSPVDARRRLFGAAEHLSICVNGITVDMPAFSGDFWEDARFYAAKVGRFNDPDVLGYGIRAVRAAVLQAATPELAAAVWTHVYGAELLVTNLGRVDIPVLYGDLRVTGLWGPCVSMGIEGEETIGAITLDGRLHLLHTSFDPPAGFLDLVTAGLSKAQCK